jgi:hypothetical protein
MNKIGPFLLLALVATSAACGPGRGAGRDELVNTTLSGYAYYRDALSGAKVESEAFIAAEVFPK